MSDGDKKASDMTMHEFYAGMAMQGILAMCADSQCEPTSYDDLARDALGYADALVARIKKRRFDKAADTIKRNGL